ncbi:MAG: hypothetical protein HYS43_01145 [Candidatus Liptonbacteria bacterium]|nr:hypothetical protein [Candidatus Liptonbacteria bacterium]
MRRCALCGKSSRMVGHREKLRGKYNPTGERRRYPNVQWLTRPDGSRIRACIQCKRTNAKTVPM